MTDRPINPDTSDANADADADKLARLQRLAERRAARPAAGGATSPAPVRSRPKHPAGMARVWVAAASATSAFGLLAAMAITQRPAATVVAAATAPAPAPAPAPQVIIIYRNTPTTTPTAAPTSAQATAALVGAPSSPVVRAATPAPRLAPIARTPVTASHASR